MIGHPLPDVPGSLTRNRGTCRHCRYHGPRGDGNHAGDVPDIAEAATYHRAQIEARAKAGADSIEALTLTNANEAAGLVQTTNQTGLPVGILFTVERDGTLPDGNPLQTVISRVDESGDVAYFGINCAYPDHILPALTEGRWLERIVEIRPNATSKSHVELDQSEELDPGDVDDLVRGVDELQLRLPNPTIIGGCCGTDHNHVARLWVVVG